MYAGRGLNTWSDCRCGKTYCCCWLGPTARFRRTPFSPRVEGSRRSRGAPCGPRLCCFWDARLRKRKAALEIDIGELLPGAARHDKAGTVLTPPRLNSALGVFITEQTRLAEYCSIDMLLHPRLVRGRSLETDTTWFSNSPTVQGGGKRRPGTKWRARSVAKRSTG
jgi:hypothetical protein